MPNKGTNKIDILPAKIKGEIEERFLNNDTILSVVRFLQEKYRIWLDRETVSKYRKRFFETYQEEERKQNTPAQVQEIVEPESNEEEIKNVQIVTNKKDLLEKLIADSYQRLQDIRKMNKRRYDPKWESFISSYMENIRKIVETLSKLDETFDNDSAKIDNMVKSHMAKLLKCVYETIKIVCPDKANRFKEVLSQKYKEESKKLENKNAENAE